MIGQDGSLLIPAEYCAEDAIEAGQICEIERVGEREYRLKLQDPKTPKSLVDHLLACPVKGFFEPLPRTETTMNYVPFEFEE